MNAPKEKVKPQATKVAGKVTAQELFGASSGETPWQEHLKELTSAWNAEIHELLNIKFDSYEQALTTLVDRVATRIKPKPGLEAEMKQFIYDLIDTDEDMKAELKAVLGVR